ncbi:hypothetical protein A8C32_16475 [Flavivirga aquatica]|uniref:CBM-cenC domain-containing protein n=1 Tax=Flavivirga aquatica TaxID=1849968 RepID=A0A1E5T9J3_9FLAO|nr:hypothetical protein [Flavivirga aquatica]OEK08049.1 hypothetical protein A8C32_16475 [Flavivirga aquatica]
MKSIIKINLVFIFILVVNSLSSQECEPILTYSQSTFSSTSGSNNSFTGNISGSNWTAINTPDILKTEWENSCSNGFECDENTPNKIVRRDISSNVQIESTNINSGFVDFDATIHSKNDNMLGARHGEGISVNVKLDPNKKYLLRFSQGNARRHRPKQRKNSARWVVTLDDMPIGKSKYIPIAEYDLPFTWHESTIIIEPSHTKSASENRVLKIVMESLFNKFYKVTQPPSHYSHSKDMNYMLIDNITLIQEGTCKELPAISSRDNSSFIPKVSNDNDEFNYIISAWVKETQTEGTALSSYSSSIDITFSNGTTTSSIHSFSPQGAIIEGWQRIEGMFSIPEGSTTINIAFNKSVDLESVYYDDIRIHNAEGNMKSFVYDPLTQRLMAELDENNYATLYEYDNEGGLVRVKKETERGVYTIQETRSGNILKENINN